MRKMLVSVGRLLSFACLGLVFGAGFSAAHAYKVSPLVHNLSPAGKKAISFITIDNTHDYPLTVEMTVERRTIVDGLVESDQPADDDFIVFPPQAIIQPGAKQRVQVRYIGQPTEKSEIYRLKVAQVPVSLEEQENARVEVAYNFIAAIYVAPDNAKTDLSVTAIAPQENGSYAVTIENAGNYHALLTSFVWEATATDGTSAVLKTDELPIQDVPFVEPFGKRTIILEKEILGTLVGLSGLTIKEIK